MGVAAAKALEKAAEIKALQGSGRRGQVEKNSKIFISGAGVAGLTAALWLAKAGFRPTVVERAPSVRADGFLISLSHDAYRSAEALGLMPALQERRIGITRSSYHDPSGRCLLALDYEDLFRGLDILQLTRDDLEAVLFEAARDVADIRCGLRAVEMAQRSDGVDVTFSDGRSEAFDAVIGADGLHSGVRELSFPPEKIRRHRLGLCVAAARLPNFIGLAQKFETHMETNRYLALFTTREGGLGGVFVWASEEETVPPPESRAAKLQEAFRGTSDFVKSIVDHCPKNGGIYMDSLSQIEMPSWHEGRVAVVGDAAHCLTLFSGRGAAAAFNGATQLAKALIDLPPEAAFQRYEAAIRPVLSKIQPATRSAARWYVPRSRHRECLRNNAMRFLPNAVFQAYFRGKYSKA